MQHVNQHAQLVAVLPQVLYSLHAMQLAKQDVQLVLEL